MLRRIGIQSTSRSVLAYHAQKRLSAAVAVTAENEVTDTGLKLSRDDRNKFYQLRDFMRAEIEKMCLSACKTGELSKEEIAENIDKVGLWASEMRLNLKLKHPYADVIDFCIKNELSITSELYKRYMKSEEFRSLAENSDDLRPHLYTSGAVLLVKQFNTNEPNFDTLTRQKLIVDFLNNYFTNNTWISYINPIILYLASKEDSSFIWNVASSLKREQGTFLTSIVSELLDQNKMERLKELMESKLKTDMDVRIFTNRVTNQLLRRLKNIKTDSPASLAELQTISQVIAAGFKKNEHNSTGGLALATILASSTISDDIVKRLIDYLMEDSSVLVPKSEIARIETQLRNANLPQRAKLVFRMRHKTSTYQRWMKTEDLDDLINEAEKLNHASDMRPEILCALYSVIIKKAVVANPIALKCLVSVLPNYQAAEKRTSDWDFKQFRSEFSQAHNAAISYALLNRNYEAFDKLFELRTLKTYNLDQIILFTLAYFERDMSERANEILAHLRETPISIDDRTLNSVVYSDFMRTIISEKVVRDFIQLLSKHFGVSSTWERRLIAAVQLNDLHKLIDEGKLEEVIKKIVKMGESIVKDPTTSFVLIDLLKAALQANNTQIFMKTKEFIETHGDPYTVVLYIGLSFLELNDSRWQRMLNKIKHIPTDILRQLVRRETKARRPDVLHTLFNIMNRPDTSTVELEILLEETVKSYYNNHDLEGLRNIYDKVRNSSFYLSAKLKVKIEQNIKTLEKESTSGEESSSTTPKSTSPFESST